MNPGESPMSGFGNAVWPSRTDVLGQGFVSANGAPSLIASGYQQPAMMASQVVPRGVREANEEASSSDCDAVSVHSGASEKFRGAGNEIVKLSGPIAFAGDSDADKIPIRKEGRAKCMHCGAIGVKHSFYTKERKYCSRECAKAAGVGSRSPMVSRGSSSEVEIPPAKLPRRDRPRMAPERIAADALAYAIGHAEDANVARLLFGAPRITFLDESRSYPDDEYKIGPFNLDTEGSYDWADCIGDPDFRAAPVSCFRHAPLASIWDKICVGMKVEVPCRAEDVLAEVPEEDEKFWIATVIRVQGYMAMLRYVGMPDPKSDPSSQTLGDFWMHLCSDEMKPVGWCAGQQKVLTPPPWIQNLHADWRDFLVRTLTGSRTLLRNFGDERRERTISNFKPGVRVEVIDREKISQVRVATVHDVFGGRLHLRYQGLGEDDPGTWAHECSALVRPVGWALEHLHDMEVSAEYLDRIYRGIREPRDAPPEIFLSEPSDDEDNAPPENVRDFMPGDKLECVDPLNANIIGSATVRRVLPGRYLMIEMDWYHENERERDAFCRHASSKYIFPCGFCATYGLSIKAPAGYDDDTFTWMPYFDSTGESPAPIELFQRVSISHGFEPGMKLECVDATDPRLICAATVVQVVERLLRIHFDGWDEEYDMWVDCDSPDIFPLGFCCLIDYPLQSPREQTEPRKKRGVGRKAKRRRGPQLKSANTSRNSLTPQPMGEAVVPEHASTGELPAPLGITGEPPATEADGEDVEEPRDDKENDLNAEIGTAVLQSDGAPGSELDPSRVPDWSEQDVARFLAVNNSAQFAPKFLQEHIDGKRLLELKLADMLRLTLGKMGPAAKLNKMVQDLLKATPSLFRARGSVSRNR